MRTCCICNHFTASELELREVTPCLVLCRHALHFEALLQEHAARCSDAWTSPKVHSRDRAINSVSPAEWHGLELSR